jgi:hypothetical protein
MFVNNVIEVVFAGHLSRPSLDVASAARSSIAAVSIGSPSGRASQTVLQLTRSKWPCGPHMMWVNLSFGGHTGLTGLDVERSCGWIVDI